jgi:cytochrome P460
MTASARGRRSRLVLAVLAALLAARSDGARVLEAEAESGAAATGAPVYDADGALRRPQGYQEWTFVGASLGLSYAEGASESGPGEFHHVYLRPSSYADFRRTGRFPEGTVLVLELHEAAQKVAPSRHGLFEGRRVAVEAAVKDSARHPEGWAYYSFGDGSRPTATAFPRGACFDCHRQHAARDNVFMQFYPVLRDGGH